MVEMRLVVKERVDLPTKSYAILAKEKDQPSHKKKLKIIFWKPHQNHERTQSNKVSNEKLVFKPSCNGLEQQYKKKSKMEFWNNAQNHEPMRLDKEFLNDQQFGYKSDWSGSGGR